MKYGMEPSTATRPAQIRVSADSSDMSLSLERIKYLVAMRLAESALVTAH